MKRDQDAFGRMIWAHAGGRDSTHFIERNDGHLDHMTGAIYFDSTARWSGGEKLAMPQIKGRVLDIGCGAGRHALALQRRGLKVTGIDASPLSIRVCRDRGLKDARVLGIEHVNRLAGEAFDSVILFGHNLGLLGTPQRARRILKAIGRATSPQARIFAGSLNIHHTSNPDHLAYQRANRAHGRLPGQLRLRVRFGARVSPWFDYLMASPTEVKGLLIGTGWRVARVLPRGGISYVAVIVKSSEYR